MHDRTEADSTNIDPMASTFKGASRTENMDQDLRFGDMERDVKAPGIVVQKDFTVKRSA